MAVGDRKLLEVPLASGLQQKFDKRSGPSDSGNVFQNCVRLKNGAIRKRFGHTALGNTSPNGPMRTAQALINVGSVMGIIGDSFATSANTILYTRNEVLSSGWTLAGAVPQADVLDRVIAASFQANPTDYDIAVATNGLVVVVALVGGQLFTTYLDGSGANPTFAPVLAISSSALTQGFTAIGPKLIACGNRILLICADSLGGLRVQGMDATNPIAGWGTLRTLTLGAAAAASLTTGVFDAVAIVGDTTRFAVCFEGSTTSSVVLSTYSSADPYTIGVTKRWETQGNFNTFASMGLQANNGGRYWVTWVATAGASIGGAAGVGRVGFWNELANTIGTPGTAMTYAAGITVGKCVPLGYPPGPTIAKVLFSTGYANASASMTKAFIQWNDMQDTAGVATPQIAGGRQNTGVQLATRPIYESVFDMVGNQGGFVFAVYLPSAVQGTVFTVAIDSSVAADPPFRTIGTFSPRLTRSVNQPLISGGSFTLPNLLNMPAALGSGDVYAFPMTFASQTFHQNIALQLVELLPTKIPIAANRGNGTALMSASTPWVFDGQYITEAAFAAYPEIGTVTPSGAGGSMATGVYQYIATWEWYDAKGQIHQSATSVPVTANVIGPTGSVQLVIPCPPIGYKANQFQFVSTSTAVATPPPWIVVYRTTSGGTIFYRTTADPAPTGNQAFVGQGPITITDTQADATLTAATTAQLLYTTGGVLDNFCPPASRAVVQHKSRFFLAGCDEPAQVWPSSPFISGVAPGWNENINFLATGAVRALASMDDKLILFVQRGLAYGIEYVTGDGPTNLGTQSDWTPPQQIQSDSGAVDQRCVCSGPFGVLYRSNVGGPNATGGIFLLGRDLTIQYVGAPVEDALSANPVVTSMVLHPNAGRVYITCVQGDFDVPLVGIRLVWDYLQNVWSQDAISDPDVPQTGVAGARGAVVSQTPSGPAYHWMSTSGRIYRETNGIGANSYTDAGTWITMQFSTSWQKLAYSGIQQVWAVQVQSDSLDPSDLTVQLTYDYAPSSYYNETRIFSASAQATMDRFPQVDVEMMPLLQKAKAIQIQLTDGPPTGGPTATTGQGPNWATVTLEIGQDDGRYPNLGPGQRS